MNRSCGLILTSLLLSGCGAFRNVSIVRPVPYQDVDPRRYEAFQNLYIRFEKTPSSKLEQALDSLAKALVKSNERQNSPFPINTAVVGKKMSQEIARAEGRVAAYRVAPEALADDPFLRRLSPAGVLTVKIAAVLFLRSHEETKKSWTYQVYLTGSYELTLIPAQKILHTGNFSTHVGEERADDSEPSDYFLKDLQDKALMDLGRDLVARLFPVHFVHASRPTFKKEEEQILWKKYFNMAVAAEVKKDYPTAQNYYQLAEEAAVDSAEAKKIKWETINKTIFDLVQRPPHPIIHDGWFSQRIALLPFSDEVVNVDAPGLVRDAIFNALTLNGYALPPLSEIDETLQQHGFTDGGQLNAVSKDKLAAWTQADFLLAGHVEEFNEVNLGIYHKRIVKGHLSLWDAKTKEEFWKADNTVSNQEVAVKGGQAAVNFLGGLANALAERLAKKPLGAEVEVFTRQSLETLPAREPASTSH